MIDINEQFQSVIKDLQDGKRPNCEYTAEEIRTFKQEFKRLNELKDWQEMIPILCILDNTITLDRSLYPELTYCLKECEDHEVLVLALGVARKQIIDEHHKRGERLPFDFLELLEGLIGHEEAEVFEWCLRLIESLGSQSIFFKEAILKARPGFFSRFNQHKKACTEIIELLERRWG